MNNPTRPVAATTQTISTGRTPAPLDSRRTNTMAMAAASATAATYGTTVALAVLVALAMCLPAGEAANSLAINVDGKIMYGASDVDDGSGFSYLDVGMDPNAEVRPSLNVAVAAALSDTERRLTLRSDIGDFLDLIPGEEVRQRVDDHYRSDADVQTALTYIAGKEFVALLHEVREVQDFQRWLTHAGVNIKEVLQRLANLVGLSKLGRAGVLVVPTATAATAAVNQSAGGGLLSGTAVSQTTIGGLTGLLEDILALIPKEDVFLMFLEKLDSSMEFANLVESMGTPEFAACFDALKRSTDLKKTATELNKHKIDVRKIIELLQSFFRFGAL